MDIWPFVAPVYSSATYGSVVTAQFWDYPNTVAALGNLDDEIEMNPDGTIRALRLRGKLDRPDPNVPPYLFRPLDLLIEHRVEGQSGSTEVSLSSETTGTAYPLGPLGPAAAWQEGSSPPGAAIIDIPGTNQARNVRLHAGPIPILFWPFPRITPEVATPIPIPGHGPGPGPGPLMALTAALHRIESDLVDVKQQLEALRDART